MTQPFRNHKYFQSKVLPDLSVSLRQDHIFILAGRPFDAFSNGLWGGGASRARAFVNWKVPLSYRSANPEHMMRDQIEAWGYSLEETIGLQTAAKLTHASIHEKAGDEFRLLCCTTAGTTNAARAGTERETFSSYQLGTINIVLLIDGKLTPAAMVNGMLTAAEAKAAALQDLHIMDANGMAATGTTTDAMVLAVSQSEACKATHLFAGTATTVGNAIGQAVYQTVYEAVATQGEN